MQSSYWVLVLAIAVGAVGLIQYVKGLISKAPTWVWAASLPVICIAGSILLTPWPWCVLVAVLAITLGQLGYETLVQGILAAIDSATGANIQLPPKTPPA